MPHTRAKTIEALEAKSVADEKKIRDLEAHKKWAFAIRKAHDKRKREDKERIAKLLLDVTDVKKKMADAAVAVQENAVALQQKVVELYRKHTTIDLQLQEVQGRALDLMKELKTLKTQLGIIIEV